MQKGENIYADHFILRQIIPAANVPENIEAHEYAENEMKVTRRLCSKTTGEFKVLRKTLAFINICADEKEVFLIMLSIKRSQNYLCFSKVYNSKRILWHCIQQIPG